MKDDEMKLSEQYAFTTPSPDEDKDIWVVPLEIAARLEAKLESITCGECGKNMLGCECD